MMNRTMKVARAAAAVVGIVAPVAATAAPISYNESIDGDLAVGGTLPVLALGVGANTVSGSTGSAGSLPDFDSFAFAVASGTELFGIRLELVDAVGSFTSASWNLRPGNVVNTADPNPPLALVEALSPGSYAYGGAPLQAGTYHFVARDFRWSGGPPAFGDYTFTLTVRDSAVQAVPEPGALALAGLALAAAGAAARRGRR